MVFITIKIKHVVIINIAVINVKREIRVIVRNSNDINNDTVCL